MDNKVVWISVDAVRPDAVEACAHPFYKKLMEKSAYTLNGSSMNPSITLPCHTSMFYSVPPQRHGITINQWMPPARPLPSVMDLAHQAGAKTAMCYTWDFLREMAAPGSIDHTYHFAKLRTFEGEMYSDRMVTQAACEFLKHHDIDLMFVYISATDWCGHKYGWMSKEYMKALENAAQCLETIQNALDERYNLFVVTDHGGHQKTHGTLMEEDMRIPLFFQGNCFPPGILPSGISLLDIAPTIAACLGFAPNDEWEGKSLL